MVGVLGDGRFTGLDDEQPDLFSGAPRCTSG